MIGIENDSFKGELYKFVSVASFQSYRTLSCTNIFRYTKRASERICRILPIENSCDMPSFHYCELDQKHVFHAPSPSRSGRASHLMTFSQPYAAPTSINAHIARSNN